MHRTGAFTASLTVHFDIFRVTHARSLRICYIKCDLESTSQSTDSEDRYVAYNLHTYQNNC